jgi:hypothetical protein
VRNADLGIEAVFGVIDGGGNAAHGNGNPMHGQQESWWRLGLGPGAARPILALIAISTWRCSIPAICGFSKRPPTAAALSLGVRSVSALPQTSASGLSGSDTRSVYGRTDLNWSAP